MYQRRVFIHTTTRLVCTQVLSGAVELGRLEDIGHALIPELLVFRNQPRGRIAIQHHPSRQTDDRIQQRDAKHEVLVEAKLHPILRHVHVADEIDLRLFRHEQPLRPDDPLLHRSRR